MIQQVINSEKTHSQRIIDSLYEYHDFMESIATLVDLGCGDGRDLEWWATATTQDDSPQPLNIQCVGVDLHEQFPLARQHANVTYQRADFEETILPPKKGFDILWCHDAFHHAVNPLQTLSNWWQVASEGAMLMLAVPQTVAVHQRKLTCVLPPQGWYHHTMVSLMRLLAATGWDCRAGFFQQLPGDPWISAVVYKSHTQPSNPKTLTWYDLADTGLLPESACASIMAHGYLRQHDLVVPWIDKSLAAMAQL